MINHVRTLLLNKNGAERPAADFFYEEYVQDDYHSVELGRLTAVREALLGSNADDAYINYRLHQIMKVLHSTEYVSYVTALDARFTYDHERAITEVEPTYAVHGMTETAAEGDILFLGRAEAAEKEYRLLHVWTAEIVAADTVRLIHKNPAETSEQTYVVSSGVSEIIDLPSTTDVSFRFNGSQAVGKKWLLSVRKRPIGGPEDMVASLAVLGEEADSVLYSTVEPYDTFRRLWLQHPYWNYRLSGAVLALAYRTEALRNGE